MKPNLSNIKNIVFDLGKVLLNLDFNASIGAFTELGLNAEVVNNKQAYSDPIFYALETGQTTPEKFRNRIRQVLKKPSLTDLQIDQAWCAMLLDIPSERVQLLQQLGKQYNVYLFSNTNEIHISYLHKNFFDTYHIEFPSLFVKDFYSHEIHDRKPELSSFQKVIKLAGIIPSETLFVDDLKENIAGAEKAGLKTLWLEEGMEVSELF
ncbi:putative hydrolase of the HAD superfamily [Mariniphaga anaerophila]|uniref:Putative hydrolase of the HAD superfamily n=1 Tax=Mariniphaga anaerophila TaxID=1484053 RepID=A0A1M5BP33_9BACT|nr:HAD family phosphatase [Mariniphaga anaerophila]SHF44383.1 putative hydrolase of the HAD superfamily [Mariniphaga anaerophila]